MTVQQHVGNEAADAMAARGIEAHLQAHAFSSWLADAKKKQAEVVARVHALIVAVLRAAAAARADPLAKIRRIKKRVVRVDLPDHEGPLAFEQLARVQRVVGASFVEASSFRAIMEYLLSVRWARAERGVSWIELLADFSVYGAGWHILDKRKPGDLVMP
eukprot:11845099-Alexandrium_andersonii.AAC.1